MNLEYYLLIAPPILLALTIHEFAHAYIANKLGDSTAKDHGRLTLNPLKHLDVMGTLMVFIIRIGWAKPVPVNPMYFRNPKRDMLWVSLAGPLSNILLAFALGFLYRIMNITIFQYENSLIIQMIKFMMSYGIIINLILAFFNILPIPPLDGSKILAGVLPPQYEAWYEKYMGYGHYVLLGLIVLSFAANIPIFSMLYLPFVRFFSLIFAGTQFL
ncbi:site-2 protease family protein [candidate division KSB1 bacterium]|nr:site-2 protease family protein [candidate division KSB1 bacterium]